MLRTIIVLFLSLISALSYAWVCPNNFNQIAVGDSVEQVIAACGKPASETTSEAGYRGPQEWQFFVSIQKPLNNSGALPGANPSVRMSVAFVNNKIINITVQGTSLASTSLCGPTISVGDSDEVVKKNCGKPTFIQKQEGSDNQKKIEIREFKYDTTPPNILVFENDILKDRK